MEPYWTFHLSRYVFQVQDLNFQWVTTWWGLSLIVFFFGGGFLASLKLNRSLFLKAVLQNISVYGFLVFLILFGLQKSHIFWGLRWYSVMYLLAFLIVYLSGLYWIKKRSWQLTETTLVSLISYCIIGMLLGARLAYVFVYNWDLYKNNLWEIVATWEGGLSFHGGVVGVCLSLFLFCKLNKISFFHITDKLARVVPLGIGLGRIGNFMNGELWGRPISSHVPWAVIFPEAGPEPRHPSQIYQSLGEGWCLFLTLFIISRFKQPEGRLSSCFLIFYCLYRFIVEYFRDADVQVSYYFIKYGWAPLPAYPDAPWWQIFTMGQILCFLFFIMGLILFFWTSGNIKEGSPEWRARVDQCL